MGLRLNRTSEADRKRTILIMGLNRYHQLQQLERLDPDAYRAVMMALETGFVSLAKRGITEAMQKALIRLARPPENLLELAVSEVKWREQWANGEVVTLWKAGERAAWLKNENGFINLTVFKDAKRLDQRFYSPPLLVGFLDCRSGWEVSPVVYDEYPVWSKVSIINN